MIQDKLLAWINRKMGVQEKPLTASASYLGVIVYVIWQNEVYSLCSYHPGGEGLFKVDNYDLTADFNKSSIF